MRGICPVVAALYAEQAGADNQGFRLHRTYEKIVEGMCALLTEEEGVVLLAERRVCYSAEPFLG